MAPQGTTDLLAWELGKAIGLVASRLDTPEAFRAWLAQLGWDVALPQAAALTLLRQRLADVEAALAGIDLDRPADEQHDKYGELLLAVAAFFAAVRDVAELFRGAALPSGFLDTAPKQLADDIVIGHLERFHPALLAALRVFGLATSEAHRANGERPPSTGRALHLDRIGRVLNDPTTAFRTLYQWGSDALDASALLDAASLLAHGLGIPAHRVMPAPDVVTDLYSHLSAVEIVALRVLQVPLYEAVGDSEPDDEAIEEISGFVEVGLLLLPILGGWTAGRRSTHGVALQPYARGSAELELPLSGMWSLVLRGAIGADLLIEIRPAGIGMSVRGESATRTRFSGSAQVLIAASPAPDEDRLIVFGEAGGTRFDMLGASLGLTARASQNDFEVGFEAELKGGRFVFSTARADNFVRQAVPATFEAEADLLVGWSSQRGVYFGGSGGLDLALPVHRQVGPFAFKTIHLRAVPRDDASIPISIAASGDVSLGPVVATIDRIGVDALLSFPPDGAGRYGPVNLDFIFKPPNGAGISVNAAAVTGGGYLFFDNEKQQYAGALQLQLANGIAVSAFGLLTTTLPDGRPGFSLFVMITAEGFSPVQLGFGFTLTGLGGLVGINRIADADALRAGLRARTLDSVLFPKDPIRNAPQIVSSINAVFPPAADRFLFGPVAKIAWGTPTLLTINLAIVLELPAPIRLLVLAQLKALLPANSDDQTALVRVNMDAVGVIDFDRGEISLDAILYDSKIAQFSVSGETCLRARWKGEPMFLLAIGGFNPRFPVPAGFPRLNRLTVSLSSTDSVRLRLESYLALTSTTVQFGARLDLLIKVSEFALQGTLGFDTFLQFNPFGFIADMAADLALKRGTSTLLMVNVAMTLSGPSPWHARGRATFEVLFIKFTVAFDVTVGERPLPPPQPAVDVRKRLVEALQDPRNWSVNLPAGAIPMVTFRKASASAGVLVHPLGSLAVQQRVVPLGVEIARYGTATVEGERRFDVTEVRLNGSTVFAAARSPVMDSFAPGELFHLSNDEQLSRPAFEPFQAGFRFTAGGLAFCILRLDPPTHQIARAAYLRYLARTRPREVQDWLAAEYELTHPSPAQIQVRAYYKYVARGRVPGRALDDWLAAEAELSRPTPQQIAQRAYYRHIAAGPVPVHAAEDWENARAGLIGPACIVTRTPTFDVFVIDDDTAAARTLVDNAPAAAATEADFAAADLLSVAPRAAGAERYAAPPRTRLTIKAPAYAVASTQDLSVTRVAATYTEAAEELGKMIRANLAARQAFHVVGRHEREPA